MKQYARGDGRPGIRKVQGIFWCSRYDAQPRQGFNDGITRKHCPELLAVARLLRRPGTYAVQGGPKYYLAFS